MGGDAAWIREQVPAGAIDCYVNANPPGSGVSWSRTDHVFGSSQDLKPLDANGLIAAMDDWGIGRALLAPPPMGSTGDPDAGHRWTLEAVQKYPERLRLSVRVNPRDGMTAVRQLESYVRNDGGAALRLVPGLIGLSMNDKAYFPVYAKCVELGIPITVTCGMPAARLPSYLQHPQYLDDVCVFFPELTIVSTHGGSPWSDELVGLMAHWPNLYHMLSAFAPRYYPKEIIDYLNSSRGRQKVMFATDFPLMSFQRAVTELPTAGISEKSLPYFLRHNAEKVFWGGE
jgi:predicted TIM-barrel fold metal-dependent hydrolase